MNPYQRHLDGDCWSPVCPYCAAEVQQARMAPPDEEPDDDE